MLLSLYHQGFHLLTSLFSDLLNSFPFRPRHVSFLLPPTVTLETIETMFDQGNFPKLGDLAPALTYAVILSLVRFLLQSFLVKVREHEGIKLYSDIFAVKGIQRIRELMKSSLRVLPLSLVFFNSGIVLHFTHTLHFNFLKPLAEYCMMIKLSPFTRRKEIDRLFSEEGHKSVTVSPLHFSHFVFLLIFFSFQSFIFVVRSQEQQLTDASVSLSLSVSDLRIYLLSRRRYSVNQKKYVKFVEALWRFLFYSLFVVLGVRCLVYPEVVPWVKDTNEHWAGESPLSQSCCFSLN